MGYDFDLIVIGGGAGGLVSAGFAAKIGARVALVSKSPLGGECLYTGCVPSKAMAAAAKSIHSVRKASLFGIEVPEGRVRCDFEKVMTRLQGVIGELEVHDSSAFMKATYGIEEIYRGTASFVDSHTIQVAPLSSGTLKAEESRSTRVTAKRFVIATGATAWVPPIDGLADVPYWTHENLFEQRVLPERFAIIGGGPIGVEMAQAFQRLGSEVHLMDRGARILAHESPETSAYVEAFMRKEGVQFYLNARLRTVKEEPHPEGVGTQIVLESESEPPLRVERVLVATGKRPVVHGLNLEAAGVAFDTRRGITVNEHCRTSARHIWAVGDVSGRLQFTHYAEHQAKVAMNDALIRWPKKMETEAVPWITFTDPEVAHVGLHYEAAQKKFGEDAVLKLHVDLNEVDRYCIDASPGFAEAYVKRNGEILGATIVGESGGELIHEIALAMRTQQKITVMGEMIHAYPGRSDALKKLTMLFYEETLFKTSLARWLKRWVRL